MANPTYGNAVLSIRDVKFTKLDGSAQADVGAAQELMVKLVYRVGKLYGDDELFAIVSRVSEAEGRMKSGTISSEALGIALGITPSETGTTPNRITTFTVAANARLPYFKIYGMAYDDQLGAFQVIINKAKITGDTEFAMKDGDNDFVTPGFDFAVVRDGSDNLITLKQLETAAALPSS